MDTGKSKGLAYHQDVLRNRAEPTGGHEKAICAECGENYVFALRDSYHTFSVGISTILECLSIAEANGAVPEIDAGWWIAVVNRYDIQR